MVNGTGNLTTSNKTIASQDLQLSANMDFKSSKSLKVLVFARNYSEIILRIANLEDRVLDKGAKTYTFDVNSFARDWYLDANQHLSYDDDFDVLKNLFLNITELNLSGTVSLDYIKHQ